MPSWRWLPLAAAVCCPLLPARTAEARVQDSGPQRYDIYLHIKPAKTPPEVAKSSTSRTAGLIEDFSKSIRGEEKWELPKPESILIEGNKVIHWRVAGWTPAQTQERLARVRKRFAEDSSVRIEIVAAQMKPPTAGEIAEKLKTDPEEAWRQARFDKSFPWADLRDGHYFDLAKAKKQDPELDVTGVLFDEEGRPRAAADVRRRIQLARAVPGSQHDVKTRAPEPPPPPPYDGFVKAASSDPEVQRQLHALIYARGAIKWRGAYGPAGIGRDTFRWAQQVATEEERRILAKGVKDEQANILAARIILDRHKMMFGSKDPHALHKAVAANVYGAGNVRKNPSLKGYKAYLERFELARQNGIEHVLDPSRPKDKPRPKPVTPESWAQRIVSRLRESVYTYTGQAPPTGRRDHFKNVPKKLVTEVRRKVEDPEVSNAMIALAEAEGGVNAGTSVDGARGILQITPETARWECGIRRSSQLKDPDINLRCAQKVFTTRLEKVNGDLVLAWANYNLKVKWHKIAINEGRVPNIPETVRHVTRAAYRYYQLTGDSRYDPGSRAFREKYFKSRQALAWSEKAYRDLQRWDRNEGYKGDDGYRPVEKVPALEGTRHASGAVRAPGRWRLNSTGTHWYRRSAKPGQRWDIYPYRKNGRITTPPA